MVCLSEKVLLTIAFVNEDVVVVSDDGGILYFISLTSKTILSKIEVELEVLRIVMLSDGRLALGCRCGSCVFIEPPESVRGIVANGAAVLYQDSCHDAAGKRPSPHARMTGEGGQLEMWKDIGVSKDSVREFKSDEVAASIAAFIVNYESHFTLLFTLRNARMLL